MMSFSMTHRVVEKEKKDSLSLSLSLSHTHTHTHCVCGVCVCVYVCVHLQVYMANNVDHSLEMYKQLFVSLFNL